MRGTDINLRISMVDTALWLVDSQARVPAESRREGMNPSSVSPSILFVGSTGVKGPQSNWGHFLYVLTFG